MPNRIRDTFTAHDVILHPSVTEKTMAIMDANNALEFLVRREATKGQIKAAVKELFDADVEKVTTRVTKHGKKAIVMFPDDVSAEEIGMRIGVF